MEKAGDCVEFVERKWEKCYQCPSCDIVLNSDEVKYHCELEVGRLAERQKNQVTSVLITEEENRTRKTNAKPCAWGIYQKVRRNRQSRSEMNSRKRSPTDTKYSTKINQDVNGHLEKSLNSSIERIDAISEDAVNNEGEFEEYEWAGQKRIRVSSLLQGGYASVGIGTNINNKENEEDEDLNVDEDDSKMYGPPQYNDSDIIAVTYIPNENAKELFKNNCLPELSTDDIDSESSSASREQKTMGSEGVGNYEQEMISYEYLQKNNLKSVQQIIVSLKSKLRKWENHSQNKFKCLICLDEYHNPAISVSCWHVHCEECWLRSLGARKLCPQCNLITSPSDLRRIYM